MKRPRLCLLVFLLVLVGAVPSAGAPAEKERVSKITGNLVCTCGCANIIVASCDCGQAAEMTKEVASFVKAGVADEATYQAFEKKYGPRVLGAPKAKGFNLLAWVLPFVGLALGGVIVTVAVRRMRKRNDQAEAVGPLPEIDEKYRRQLEDELEE